MDDDKSMLEQIKDTAAAMVSSIASPESGTQMDMPRNQSGADIKRAAARKRPAKRVVPRANKRSAAEARVAAKKKTAAKKSAPKKAAAKKKTAVKKTAKKQPPKKS